MTVHWPRVLQRIALCASCACSGSTTGPSDQGGSGASKPPAMADAGGSRSQGGEAGAANAGSGPRGRDAGITTSSGTGGADSGMRPAGAGGTTATGAGGNANGGAAAMGGSTPGPVNVGPSSLPAGPGAGDQQKPSAAGAPNLRVLPWAGFKGAASYTFDDSQPSHVAHFAELKATGVPLTWYLNNSNNWVADYDATWKQALAAGHELGNHTVHHCNFDLSGCTGALASIDLEIDDCSKYITDTLDGPPVLSIAYPFGDGGYVAKSRMRFLLGRGTGGGMVGPDDSTDPFTLPVMAAAGGEAAGPFSTAIDGARTSGKWVIFLFHSLLPTDQNWYAGVEIANVIASIEHGKSLSDVWIDSVAHVGAYWLGARALSAATASPVGAGMSWTWQLPDHFPSGSYVRVTIDGGELRQDGQALSWNGHGYYEVALDARELAWSP